MLPKHVGALEAKYRNCAGSLRGNSARLFNPEHVIEVAAGCPTRVCLTLHIF